MSASQALRERGALLQELRQIVQAMKNLALVELQRVGRVLPAQAQAREAVLRGWADLQPAEHEQRTARATWIVIGAERGLCGAFNAQLVSEAQLVRREDASARMLVASRRLAEWLPPAQGFTPLAGAAGLEEADAALDAWVGALAPHVDAGETAWLLHHGEAGVVRQPLWPAPLPAAQRADRPLRYLPAPALRDALQRQLLRLQLQSGLLASLQQENRWRLAQMQRAEDHLDERVAKLRGQLARLRQADITNELETLVAALPGAAAPGFPTLHPCATR